MRQKCSLTGLERSELFIEFAIAILHDSDTLQIVPEKEAPVQEFMERNLYIRLRSILKVHFGYEPAWAICINIIVEA